MTRAPSLTPIVTMVEVTTSKATHPAGTRGVLLEVVAPEVWLVELRVPDDGLVGDAWYDTTELTSEEFRVQP